jgi:carbamoyltransferase
MIMLGLNAYHGDVAAVLLRDGALVAAVEEERFRRVKHCAGFPLESIRTCLQLAGVTPMAVDHFAISRDPRAHLWRKALFTLRQRPRSSLLWDRARNATRVQHITETLAAALELDLPLVRQRLHGVEHHPAHLASAFFVSPFETSAVCAIDGFGDFVSTSDAIGRGSRLEMRDRVYFPHSLGLLYLALTQYLGFVHYGDEYKVMGLAPYGKPEYVEALRRLLHLKPGGGFALDLAYFRHQAEGVRMTWDDGEPTIGPV